MIYPDKLEQKIGFDGVRHHISGACLTEGGRRYCAEMQFMQSFSAIESALASTAEMLASLRSDDSISLDGIADIEQLLMSIRVAGTFLPVADLILVRRMIGCIGEAAAYFARHRSDDGKTPYPVLDAMTADLVPLPAVAATIDRSVDRFGNIKDNASAELAGIRSQLRAMNGRVSAIMRRVISGAISQGWLDSDTAPSMRDGRLVIPVSPMNKRKINGIVHDESASGKTIFIEPAEVVEVNNRTRELEMEERREITRILIGIAGDLRPHIDELLAAADTLSHLDFIRAKALFAMETGGTLPNLSPDTEMEWYHACHPVLQLSLQRQGKEIVPTDITLTPDKRILIISGPNAGGKSVCLKTVGTLQYMAQCGILPTLYENSQVGVFSDIFVDIGDDQSIEDDLSTYSSHLRNMKYMLAKGNPSSLVLIDEFGGGTEPQIGGAIAQAILHQFNEKNMWGVITTHYQNLKHYAEDTDGLANGSMLYDRHLMQPMFRLSIGNPGSSFALEIARKTGLPASVIAEAQEIVGSDYVNLDNYLLDITRDKRYWENKRTAIRQKEKKLEQLIARYSEDADSLREKRRSIIEDARREAQHILDSSNATIERTIHDIRAAQAEKEQTLAARQRLREERIALENQTDAEHPLLKKVPKKKKKASPAPPQSEKRELNPGDNVRLDGHGTVGTIIEISGKNAIVSFGNLRTNVKTDRLTFTTAKVDSGAGKAASFVSAATSEARRTRQLGFRQEIDVRGMRVDEAVQAVTYFIDDAIQFNASRVRILHGTGTGALRQYIRQYLASVPGIASYHDEDVRLGGAGITVVELS